MIKYYLLILALLLLTACGSSDPEPVVEVGFAEFENQEVNWEPCDFNIFNENLRELFAALGDRLECATLQTPLDWDEPRLGAINLGVLRVRAGNEAERKGAIFLNPGGPGGDGLAYGGIFGLIFANANNLELAASDLLAQVSERYDIIGFSPRGVGGSLQLFCGSNKLLPKTNFYTDRSPENLEALLTKARLVAEACQSTPNYEHINTEQTVQDMDLIRRLLGDEKLNYLGFSYGSWLGSWYAKRFPEHAGNMVLDANTEFSASFQEFFSLQPMGFQRAFEDVALAYAARNNATFELGATKEEVYSVYEALMPDLKDVFLNGAPSNNAPSVISSLYSSQAVGDIAVALVAARGVNDILTNFESPLPPESYNAFYKEVTNYVYVSDEELNSEAVEVATLIATGYTSLLNAPLEDVARLPGDATFVSVTCNDTPWIQDPNFWVDFGNEQNAAYPLLGGGFTEEPCAFWGEPTAEKPDTPDNIPPILMVQTGFDAPTPVEGASRAFESLPNAKLVYVENEMEHAIFPYNTECVDTKVAAYLLDGTLPEEDISDCPAKPLPGEDQVYPPGGVPSFGTQSLSTQAAETFEPNPLYDLVHEMIREDAADFFGH